MSIMADKEDKLHIRLHVYDTEIPIRVPREEEALYRDAAKLITERMNTYAQLFANRKSEKEFSLMAMLDIAMMYERELSRSDADPFLKSISLLSADIDKALE